MKGKSLSRVQLLAIPWTVAHQAPPSMGVSRQEYWSRVPLPSPKVYLVYLVTTKKKKKEVLVEKMHNLKSENYALLDGQNLGHKSWAQYLR